MMILGKYSMTMSSLAQLGPKHSFANDMIMKRKKCECSQVMLVSQILNNFLKSRSENIITVTASGFIPLILLDRRIIRLENTKLLLTDVPTGVGWGVRSVPPLLRPPQASSGLLRPPHAPWRSLSLRSLSFQ
ncbi:hypothetical protein F7725_017501, partial [Dissostichus mawsoni]